MQIILYTLPMLPNIIILILLRVLNWYFDDDPESNENKAMLETPSYFILELSILYGYGGDITVIFWR